ncbi:MAG: sensor histidine kinase [Bacteroidota bacterium]
MKDTRIYRLISWSSIFISLIIAVLASLLFFSPWFLVLLIPLSALLIWYIFRNIVNKTIESRLDHIYNIIYSKNRPAMGNNPDDTLSALKSDVSKWRSTQHNELEKLRLSDRYRKEFVANVTHELKTPIFTIQGYIHSLLDGAINDHEVNMIFLEKAAKNVERMSSLVADLEIITQLETGVLKFEMEVFELRPLIEEVIDSLESKISSKQRTSIIRSPEEPVYVYADKERIRQVFTNLIENSIKYGNEGGQSTIQFDQQGKSVIIEVKDDGPGIQEEHLPRLFERFYRVDKSRSRVAGGTGLGLSIVKHIIEGHQKTINVRSAPGKGTIFTFSLDSR